MKSLFILLGLSLILIAQEYTLNIPIFQNPNSLAVSTADTTGSITAPDSVEIQMGYNGPWKLLTSTVNDTSYVTAFDKTSEAKVIYALANETWWTHVNDVRFRIFNSNKSTGIDTTTSFWCFIGQTKGALTLDVIPDIIGSATHYSQSILHGN